MTPLKLLRVVCEHLDSADGNFAIAGGLAASYYRKQPRLTNDVDIALFVENQERSKEVAVTILERLAYFPAMGCIEGLEEISGTTLALVIGRSEKEELESTIDFLLPSLPWVEKAVRRGQANRIDFGFATLPSMTPEDVIIAKTFALALEPTRFKDMDDIQSIFQADNQLDLVYLVNEFERLGIALPDPLLEFAPKAMTRVSKKLEKALNIKDNG